MLGSRVLTLIQLNLLARGPGRRTLISCGVVGQTAVGDSSLVREGSVEVLRLTGGVSFAIGQALGAEVLRLALVVSGRCELSRTGLEEVIRLGNILEGRVKTTS